MTFLVRKRSGVFKLDDAATGEQVAQDTRAEDAADTGCAEVVCRGGDCR